MMAVDLVRIGYQPVLRRWLAAALCSLAALALTAQPVSAQVCTAPATSSGSTASGNINDYWPGSASAGSGSTSINTGARGAGAGNTIAAGDLVLVIQMQNATVTQSTTVTYGNGSTGSGSTSVGSTGLYEFVVASSALSAAGGSFSFSPALTNSYVAGAPNSFQVVRVPRYADVTLSGVTAAFWNGSTGGVVVADVLNTLTLGGATAVSVAGAGFRGGAGRVLTGTGTGANTVYEAPATGNWHASKGEGIGGTPKYVNAATSYNGTPVLLTNATDGYSGGSYARGAPGNAGGGGNDGNTGNTENSGGGGGSNYSAGGTGGNTWSSNLAIGGLGGAAYSGTIAFNRVFMGGGGGAGTTNNSTADGTTYTNPAGLSCASADLCSSGAAGGGIVILRANTFAGSGTIDARGSSGYNVLNDGAGGGGAGGSVVLYGIAGGSATVNVSGGDGGNAWRGDTGGTADRHGPGGGGSGGFIAFAPNTMTVTSTTAGGIQGKTTTLNDSYGTSASAGGTATFQTPNAPGAINPALCPQAYKSVRVFTDADSSGTSNVTIGDTIEWDVFFNNPSGGATMATFQATDTIGANMTYVAASLALTYAPAACATGTANASYNGAGTNSLFTAGFSLPANCAVKASYRTTVTGAATLTNQSTATTAGVNGNVLSDNVDSTTTLPANVTTAGLGTNVITQTQVAGSYDSTKATVLARPTIAKAFNPLNVPVGGTSALTLTLGNSNASAITLSSIFTDTLPTGLVVATPNGLAGTCTAGSVTATAGSSTISYASGASIAAGGCTIIVNVTNSASTGAAISNGDGVYTNSVNNSGADILTTSAGRPAAGAVNSTLNVVGGYKSVRVFTDADSTGLNAGTVGDTLEWSVFYDNPTGGNNIAAFQVTDTVGAGQTYVASSVAVTYSPAACSAGTANAGYNGAGTNTLFTAGFTFNAGCTVKITYRTTLTSVGTRTNQASATGTGLAATLTDNIDATTTGLPAGVTTLGLGASPLAQTQNAGSIDTTSLVVFNEPTVTKTFSPTFIVAGGTSTMTITVTNPAGNPASITGVSIGDTYTGTLTNAAAGSVACSGAGSATLSGGVNGGTSVGFTAGTIVAGGTCTITQSVTATTTNTNTTTAATTTGPVAMTSATANATLTIANAIGVTKSFGTNPVATNTNSLLTITLTNTNGFAATGVAFLDTYPSANMRNNGGLVSNTCGGTATISGNGTGPGTVQLSGGTIPANGSCVITVNARGTATGSYTNTIAVGAVTSTNTPANTVAATDTLDVGVAKLDKTFSAALSSGGTTTLTYSISAASVLSVSFTDTLPSGLRVASTPNVVSGCTGGSVTATALSNTITVTNKSTVANSTCTISVAITTAAAPTIGDCPQANNTNGNSNISATTNIGADITDSATGAGTASVGTGACVAVLQAPTVSKAIAAGANSSIPVLGTTTYLITLGNPNSVAITLSSLFTDTLPTGMVVATPPNIGGTCTNGSITATAGSGTITYANGASIPSGGCTIQVDVKNNASTGSAISNGNGPYTNTIAIGALVTNAGSNVAAASVVVGVVAGFKSVRVATDNDSSGTTNATIGDVLEWDVFFRNPGGGAGAVAGFQATDTIGANQTYVPGSLTLSYNPAACSAGTANASFNGAGVNTLFTSAFSVAQDCTMKLSYQTTVTGNGTLSNQATASGTALANVLTDNIDSTTTNLPGGVTTLGLGTNVLAQTQNTGTLDATTTTVLLRPTITKAFGVTDLASGSSTSLTVTIGNANASAITLTAALTDTFPAGVTIGTAGNTGTCTGVTATAGAGNFTMANGTSIPAGGCTVIVNVTSSTAGAVTNTIAIGALQTSSGKNQAAASSNLNIWAAPTLTKAITSPFNSGATTVLTLTLTNPAGNTGATTMRVDDTFPAGLTLSNTTFTFTPAACGTVTKIAGTASAAGDNNVRFTAGSTAAGSSCQVQINVTSSTAGVATNTTNAPVGLTPIATTGTAASAGYNVLVPPTVTKAFTAAAIASGGNSNLTVTIGNTNSIAITLSSAFTDTFPAGMTINTAGNTGTCTGVTATAGASNFTMANGTSIPAGGCTVIVNITSSTAGTSTNTIAIGALQTNAGNNAAAATDTLDVYTPPTIAKSFTPTSIASGGTSVLSLTVTNPAANPGAVTTIQAPDTFPAGITLSNTTFTFTPAACGTATKTSGAASAAGDNNVRLNIASLAAGSSCQLQANVTSSTTGVASNTTTALTATGPVALTGGTANASLTVLSAPTVLKSFGATNIASGGNTNLTVTLGNGNASALTLSSAFTDTFPAGMTINTAGNTGTCTGVTATAGAGSFTMASGSSIPSGGCTIIVNVTSSTPGSVNNTINAGALQTNGGNNAAAASATLTVYTPPTIAKSFTPTSIASGGTSVLSLTVTNPSANPGAVTTIQVPDTFPAGLTLSNTTFTFTPAACGTATKTSGAASAAGDNNIRLNVASLNAGATCQLQANVTSTTVGAASNTTTALTATGPVALTGGTANATLTVLAAPTISKNFTAAAIASGGNTSLTVTIGNTNASALTLSGLFTDTFPAGMSIGTAGNTGTCTGVTATAAATSFTIANGTSIPAGGCTVIVNVTSSTAGTATNTIAIGALSTNGGSNAAAATDSVDVYTPPTVAKSFTPTSIAIGGTSVLSLTVTNPAANPGAITTVQLPDTFPAGITLSNTTFTFTPAACGTATKTAGTASAAGDNNIRLNVATLNAGSSCQLQANVTSSTVGAASNTTTAVTATGPVALTGGTANATLTVLAAPTVAKNFAVANLASGGNTNLTVTIGNTNASAITLSSLFTDTFPAGMSINTAGNTGTCAGVTATAAATSFTIANGTSIPAGGCTVIVNVTSSTAGAATNTIAIGALSTNAGSNTAAASATLNIYTPPTIAKSFTPANIASGGTSVLSLTVTNPAGNPGAVTTIQVPDTFPAGLTLSNTTFTFTPAACGTATKVAGTASAAGDNNIRLNVATLNAGSSCQLQANVTSSTVGAASNTTTALTATGPVALTGGTANATLTVLAAPTVSKNFAAANIASGGNTNLTVTIGNSNAVAITLSSIFTDNFPAGMSIGTAGNTGTCTGVTATAAATNFTIANGTSIPAGGCTVIVNVTSSTAGAASNTIAIGALQTSAGSNAASTNATLGVFAPPTITKSFTPTSIASGGTSVLSLSVTSPSGNPGAVTTITVPDTFPAGLTLSNTTFTFTPAACGTATKVGGGASASGDGNVQLNIATLNAGSSCQLQANVTSSTVGAASNTTTALTATGPVALTGGTANATLTVLAAPTLAKNFAASNLAVGGNTNLTVTIGNTNAVAITLSSLFTDTFPAGLTINTAGNTGTCTGVTATAAANNFTIANGTSIPAGGCTVIVNVTSSTAGAATNTLAIGSLSTNAGSNAAAASATLNVYTAPTIAKSFTPTNIASGGVSVLSLTVSNPAGNPGAVTTITVPDTFPAGLTLSNTTFTFTPAACGTATKVGGGASAAGDGNVQLNIASLAAGSSCQLQANVTSTTVGAASNTTTALTATGPVALTGGTANATLTVLAPPTLTKNFAAGNLAVGGNTNLTVTIGNTNAIAITLSSVFTDTFPAGLSINTAGNTGTCTGVTATAAATSFTIANGTSIPAGGCTVIVNVTSSTAGAATNTLAIGSLSTSAGSNTAAASATLNVFTPPTIAKSFTPTSIASGGTSVLSLTVTNPAANPAAVTTIQVPDTFPAGLTLANTTFTFTPAACGTATKVAGTASAAGDNNIRLNVATLNAGSSCQLQANVTSSTVGAASNTTTALTATGPVALTGGTANATLTVLAAPTLAKNFAAANIAAGGNTNLTVTIGNTNAVAITLSSLFTDSFPAGLTINTAGNTGTCTGVTATAAANNFTIANGTSIPAGGCTVIVNVTSSTAGAATNTLAIGALSTNAGSNAAAASATLNVYTAPTLTKAITTPFNSGATTTLTLTLTNPAANPGAITAQVDDTFPAGLTLANTTFTFTPAACGTVTKIAGTASAAGDNNVRFTAAGLAANSSCQVQANVTATAAGTSTNTTNAPVGTSPVNTTGTAASAMYTVQLQAPTLAKNFAVANLAAGGNTNLTVTIGNVNPIAITLSSVFTDTFPAGLTINTAGNTGTCTGVTATAAANNFTIANGTSIPAGGCTVIVNVTSSTAGAATNTLAIGSLSTNAGSNAAAASATLNVYTAPTVTKSFGAATIPAGGSTTLTLTVTNPSANPGALGTVQVPDTFPAGLTLLNTTFVFTPAACGTVTTTTGTASTAGDNNMRLNVASLNAGSSCQAVVNVTSSTPGSITNTTSAPTATTPVVLTGTTASASLNVLAAPIITKSFTATNVAVSGTTTMTITVQNTNTVALSTVAFTDTYPSGLTNSGTPGAAANPVGCTGTLTAANNGGSFALSSGTVPAASTCTYTVQVQGTTVGAKLNSTGAVTSGNAPNGSAASATLNVYTPPTVSKAFGVSTIAAGGNTTLTLTISNPAANPGTVSGISVTDVFPTTPGAMTLFNTTVTNNCTGSTLTDSGAGALNAGDVGITVSGFSLTAGSSCTVTVNVTASASGTYSNTTAAPTASGPVSLTGSVSNTATLTVVTAPTIAKAFTASNIALNGTTTMNFTVTNTNASVAISGIAVNDTLPAGLTAANGTTSVCGGSLAITGGNSLAFTAGTLSGGANCVIGVTVTGTTAGAKNNTTGTISISGPTSVTGTTSNTATVNVYAPPTVTKSIVTPFGVGGVTTMTLTLANPAANVAAIGTVQVDDTLSASNLSLADTTFVFTPAACGTVTKTNGMASAAADTAIRFSVASLNPGSSCQVTVDITSTTPGATTNTTATPTAATPVSLTGSTASAAFTVVQANVAKTFGAASINDGATTTLVFTLSNGGGSPAQSGIGLGDTLPSSLQFNSATPAISYSAGCSGPANAGYVSGTHVLTIGNTIAITNGTASCTVTVAGVTNVATQTNNSCSGNPAAFTNLATNVSTTRATNTSTDQCLVVAQISPTLTKAWAPATINDAASTDLVFTLTNSGTLPAQSGIAFTETLPSSLKFTGATPTIVFGSGCSGTGVVTQGTPDTLAFSGVTMTAGTASCTVTVNGVTNRTGLVNASCSGNPAAFTNTAAAISGTANLTNGVTAQCLVVNTLPPTLTKVFTPATFADGATTTLRFTLTNSGSNPAQSGIGFVDTLPTGIKVAAGTVLGSSTCSNAATVTTATNGGSTITVSGATMTSGQTSCTIDVQVRNTSGQVNASCSGNPAAFTNSVTNISGTANVSTTGLTASCVTVTTTAPTIAKAFGPATIAANGTSTITFTVSNTNSIALTGAAFSDTLSNMKISGAQSAAGTCTGASGNSFTNNQTGSISLSGLTIPASGSCTVTVLVTSNVPGVNPNTASGVSSNEAATGAVSNTANLTVTAATPTITKSFTPSTISLGGTSQIDFTISNSNGIPLTGAAFSDTLSNMFVSATGNAGGTCTGASGNSFTANQTGMLNFTGLTIPASGSCTVTIVVKSNTPGSLPNTASGVSSNEAATGSGSNTATLTVTASAPTIAKAFSPAAINSGGTSTLTITITNPNAAAITVTSVTDTFPTSPGTGMVRAASANTGTTCTGGTVSSTSGSVTLTGGTVPANGSCTYQIDVTAATTGSYANSIAVGALTTNVGANTASASATLTVNPVANVSVTKNGPATIAWGTTITYTAVVSNAGPDAANSTVLSDNVPAAITSVSGACGSATGGASCGAVNVSGNSVTSTIASLPAGGSVTITIQGTAPQNGTLANFATAIVPSGISDPDDPGRTGAGNNTSSTVNTTVLAPDLQITKTASAASFTVGGTGSFTITPSNSGTSATSGTITVTDVLPAGLSYVSASGTGWSCMNSGQTVTCTSSNVIAISGTGNAITINVNVLSNAVPSVTNTASISGGNEPAANSGNNSAVVNVPVTGASVSTFITDGAQSGAPGTSVLYTHTFTAGTAGNVSFAATNVASPVVAGWSVQIYRDSNCNGVIDGSEGSTEISNAAQAVGSGGQVCIIVKSNIPAIASYGNQDSITVTASFTPTVGSPSTYTRSDVTTVVAVGGSGLVLMKSVRNVTTGGTAGTSNTAKPGEVLEYVITYSNSSNAPLNQIVISDNTPAFSTFVSASCTMPYPAAITNCVVAAPSVGAAGALTWTLTGSLNPSQSGTVLFRVTVQ